MVKSEYGRCRATIRTAIIVNGARGRKYIRVFLRGMGNEPAIVVSEGVARLLYERARKKGSPILYADDDMLTAQARILCKWLQGRACVVRVSHRSDSRRYPAGRWDYRVWSVA